MDQLFRFDARAAVDVSDAPSQEDGDAPADTVRLLDGKCADATIPKPSFCCQLPNGKIIVASEHRLIALSAEGKVIKQPPKVPAFVSPTGLACDGAAFYVADTATHMVHKLSLRDFSQTCAPAGGPGSGPSNLTSPRGLAVIGKVLFVSDSNNHRVMCFHSKLLEPIGLAFGGEGGRPGQFRFPHGLAVMNCGGGGGGSGGGAAASSASASELLVVADTQNHRLQCFTPDGTFVRAVGQFGDAPGCFDEPMGVDVAHRRLFVAERERLQILTLAGAPQQIIRPSAGAPQQPAGICVCANVAYVTDAAAGKLHLLSLSVVGSAGDGGPASASTSTAGGRRRGSDGGGSGDGAPGASMPSDDAASLQLKHGGGGSTRSRGGVVGGKAVAPNDEDALATAAARQPPLPTPPEVASVSLTSPDVLSSLFAVMGLRLFLPAASVCRVWAVEARAKAAELAVVRHARRLAPRDPHTGEPILGIPGDVAALSGGHLAVVDSATHQLRVLAADGVPVAVFGQRGTGPTDLCSPMGISSVGEDKDGGGGDGNGNGDGNHVLHITDSANQRVLTWRLCRAADGTGWTGGRVEALQQTAHRDDPPGDGAALAPPIGCPHGVARCGGRLFVTDTVAHGVHVLDAASLAPRAFIGRQGTAEGEFNLPRGVTILRGHAGRRAGTHLEEDGDGDGDGRGHELIVADTGNNRLACFAIAPEADDDAALGARPPCAFSRHIGGYGHAPGRFHLPCGVAALASGVDAAATYLVVCEQRRVQVLTPDGDPLQVITLPQEGLYNAITTLPRRGRLVLSDAQNRCVHELEVLPRR